MLLWDPQAAAAVVEVATQLLVAMAAWPVLEVVVVVLA
jgi:hypothetical protein